MNHSSPVALVRFLNDLLRSSDSGSPSLLILLDLSAAFDTVDHSILYRRLQEVGITGTALDFFHSYLSGRQEYVALGNLTSSVRCVPQGSVLVPLLFFIYMLPLEQQLPSAQWQQVRGHSYWHPSSN